MADPISMIEHRFTWRRSYHTPRPSPAASNCKNPAAPCSHIVFAALITINQEKRLLTLRIVRSPKCTTMFFLCHTPFPQPGEDSRPPTPHWADSWPPQHAPSLPASPKRPQHRSSALRSPPHSCAAPHPRRKNSRRFCSPECSPPATRSSPPPREIDPDTQHPVAGKCWSNGSIPCTPNRSATIFGKSISGKLPRLGSNVFRNG